MFIVLAGILFIVLLLIFGAAMETSTGVKTTPKDFFLHLLAIVTLYASAVSLGTVLFQLVNLTVPDVLSGVGYYASDMARGLIRGAIAVLIIMYPAYLATTWYLRNMYLKDSAKRNLKVRRWLISFTLFAATVIILISLISLVRYFLNGELTLRFFLKLLSVLFISGTILGYYFWDLKLDSKNPTISSN